jgi:hypothetical protein
VPELRRRAGFAQKTKSRRFITEVFFADDFQCHEAVQIDVERLVSDSHRTATQLDRFPIFASHQLIMLKSVHRVLRCWRSCIARRGLAGFNITSESLAKHADRTEFHCSRKLVAADRACASHLRAHGPNRPSDAIRASQSAWISSSTSAGSETVRLTSSRKSAV